jgi:hypothetical protein
VSAHAFEITCIGDDFGERLELVEVILFPAVPTLKRSERILAIHFK